MQGAISPDEMGARGSGGVGMVGQSVKMVHAKFGLDWSILNFWPKFGPVLVLDGRGTPKLGGTHWLWPNKGQLAQKVPSGLPILPNEG